MLEIQKKEAWTSKYRNCGSARTGLLYPGVIKSLVTTNDHLLKELDETRERHQYRGLPNLRPEKKYIANSVDPDETPHNAA
ncbi:hypothetical protein DPMN_029818, partial [Dreissena polymorpha]